MINRILSYIKSKLGITDLEDSLLNQKLDNDKLQRENKEIKLKLEQVRDMNDKNFKDNELILRHIRFINSQFSVSSDISPSGYEPSVVIIMQKGKEEVVKTYRFNGGTMEELYSILEGFGRDNNRIDKPRHMPSPGFRY